MPPPPPGRVEDTRITFAVQPFIGDSLAAAEAKRDAMVARIPLAAALTRISGTFGLDLDIPLQDITSQASQGLVAAMSSMFGEGNITLREAVGLSGLAGMIPQILGTPEQDADQLEEVWRQTGCHGFNLTLAIVPGGCEDFIDQVVPIRQQRGIFCTAYEATTLSGNLIG